MKRRKRAWEFGVVVAILLGVAISGAQAATSVKSGNWSSSETWGGSVPGDEEAVVIAAGHVVTSDVSSASLAAFTVNGTNVFVGYSTVISSTVVTVNGLITHLAQSATITNASGLWVPDNRVWLVVSNLFVATNGAIDVTAKGYGSAVNSSGYGPGGATFIANTGRGGGYGGTGAGDDSTKWGKTYGTEEAPLDPGSGGSAWAIASYAGGWGGGAIRIEASGRVTVNHTIAANGGPGNQYGGAGSGGGIYITCNTLAGSNGTISANGAAAAQSGGGGGGRVAVVYDPAAQVELNLVDKPFLHFSANQGFNGGYTPLYTPARPGTVYLSDASLLLADSLVGGRIVIPGFTSWSPDRVAISGGLFVLGEGFQLSVTNDLTVTGNGGIEISNGVLKVGGNMVINNTDTKKGICNLYAIPSDSFTVGSNLSITAGVLNWRGDPTNASSAVIGGNLSLASAGLFYAYSGATNGLSPDYGARVTVTGDVVVASGSWICPISDYTNGGSVLFRMNNLFLPHANAGFDANASGFGGSTNYGDGWGPGRGAHAPEGCGGGYGGRGAYAAGGATYGLAESPLEPGSGGGAANTHPGARGGGLVRVEAASQVLLNGVVRANGGDGVYGGGGSGGGIRIACATIAGTNGLVTANGGKSNYGGGGGGRVALLYDPVAQSNANLTATPSLLLTANQGNVARVREAQPGTLYCPDAGFFPSAAMQGGQIVIPGFAAWLPDSLAVTNGLLRFPEGFSLTVSNNVTVSGSGALEFTNAAVAVGGGLTINSGWCYFFCSPDRVCTTSLGAVVMPNAGQIHVYSGATNGVAPDYGALVNVTGGVTLAGNSWVFPYSHGTNGGAPLFRVRTLTLSAGAGFDASARGFSGRLAAPGWGPGGGRQSSNGGGGGGYGGVGGNTGGALGGTDYGSVQKPTDAGSAGGAHYIYNGAPGGGIVRIEVADKATINGTLNANGSRYIDYGGGGSGGSIYLTCRTLAGTNGVVTATGGNGTSSYGGGGGGGRIAVWRLNDQSNTNAWTIAVAGGSGVNGGAVGTVFWGLVRSPGAVMLIR